MDIAMSILPSIDPDKCTGCGLCVSVCELNALVLVDNVVTIIQTPGARQEVQIWPPLCVINMRALGLFKYHGKGTRIGLHARFQFIKNIHLCSPSSGDATLLNAPMRSKVSVACVPPKCCSELNKVVDSHGHFKSSARDRNILRDASLSGVTDASKNQTS